MEKEGNIYVAGHTGLVGSAIVRKLEDLQFHHLILKTHDELELTDQRAVDDFFEAEAPDYVIVAAGLVGGISANSEKPADFYYVNMQIAQNVLWSACKSRVKKLLYLGSACMYPKNCTQPMKEEDLLTGLPEMTNEGYALAKIGGCRLCGYIKQQYGLDFISAVPANAYGIGDCFDPQRSHVIPALFLKYEKAKRNGEKEVVLWGSGAAKREFIHTSDLADACVFLMNQDHSASHPVNIGTGEEISIRELAQMVSRIVGFEGETVWDTAKPDGMMRRMVDTARISKMGWKAAVSLEEGLTELYQHMEYRMEMEDR